MHEATSIRTHLRIRLGVSFAILAVRSVRDHADARAALPIRRRAPPTRVALTPHDQVHQQLFPQDLQSNGPGAALPNIRRQTPLHMLCEIHSVSFFSPHAKTALDLEKTERRFTLDRLSPAQHSLSLD